MSDDRCAVGEKQRRKPISGMVRHKVVKNVAKVKNDHDLDQNKGSSLGTHDLHENTASQLIDVAMFIKINHLARSEGVNVNALRDRRRGQEKNHSEDEGTTHDLVENKGSSLKNQGLCEGKIESFRGGHDVQQNKAT